LVKKNRELLDELKAERAKKAEGQEGSEALQRQVEDLKAELRKYTFDAPVNEIFRETSSFGTVFRKAFEEHFTIHQDEDGKFYIHEKDGTPIMETRTEKVGKKEGRKIYAEKTSPMELGPSSIRRVIDKRAWVKHPFG